MANLPLSQLILDDRWPGIPSPFIGIPTGGWDNTVDNFTTLTTGAQPRYPLGTKVIGYTDNTWCAGWYAMMYLMFHDYSAEDISGDFSDGNFWCAHYDGSASQGYQIDISASPYYIVSRCYTTSNTDVTKGAPIAIPCATVESDGTTAHTNGYGDAYGWFWVGGVCPCADVTLMQGTAGNLYGADVTVNISRRGSFYPDLSGATFVGRSYGDLTESDSPTVPPLGWACLTSTS